MCSGLHYRPYGNWSVPMTTQYSLHLSLDEEKNGYVAKDQLLYAL